MNKIEIIEKVNPCRLDKRKSNIAFIIGSMKNPDINQKVIDLIKKFQNISNEDVLYRYNGFEIYMHIKYIPELVSLLVANNIDLYSVYVKYDPNNRE